MARQQLTDRCSLPPHRVGRRRRGYTLVFFAMMLFGIMAMAALVIDIGFARLTQRQMQTAVDAAALEGLRFRDEIPPGYPPTTDLDVARRQQASNVVLWHFDDNLDTSGDDVAFDSESGMFGAGPLVDFAGGAGDPALAASQMMSIDPNNPVYKPSGLEPNADDVVHGDMVAGIYDKDGVHIEDPNYIRGDFTPKSEIADANEPDDESFLVRMRRLPDDFDVVDTEPGISSKGPEIPYLFARGSLANRQLIQNGVTVHGTGIADARPAMSVGAPVPSHNIPGTLDIAIDLSRWSGIAPIAQSDCFESNARTIGDPVSTDLSTVINQNGFVGLFVDDVNIDRRVVAFGFGNVDSAGNVTPDFTKLIFSQNVSGVLVGDIDSSAPIAEIVELQTGLRGRTDIVYAAITAR